MGGAAGHMNHPFDLGWVNTGSDLIDFFDKAKTFVEKKGGSSVKIDGVNVSFKVVSGPNGHEFAVDRGSMKEIDIGGITMDRVDQRFPEGHGMRPAIKTLLTILNDSIQDTKPELEELGMWNDPSLFLNTEYVAGTTNVTSYDENFLAIHGLNQFYQRVAKSGASKGNIRGGAERPVGDNGKPIKDPSREVSYDPSIMESFIKKLQPYAEKYGFQVYGDVPTDPMGEIDYSSTLSQPFTVQISPEREITKTLGEWLKDAVNPRYQTIKLKNGKRTHPLHKDLYKTILNQSLPVVDFVEEEHAEAAINGAIIMHATRVLGNDVLNSLTSPMGDVMNHEGVVIRDEEAFGPKPVKITGEFIVGGMGSAFQQDTSLTEEDFNNDGDELDARITHHDTIAIVPGAFKPPHKGHAAMVKAYAQIADKVIVLISRPTKFGRRLPNGREITAQDSLKIWDLMVGDIPNVEVDISSHASPINAAYEYVGKDGPLQPGTKVILGASNKGDDASRWAGAQKYVKDEVILLDPIRTAVEPISRTNGEPFSATDMRALIGEVENDPSAVDKLEEFIGKDNVADLLNILGLDAFVDIEETSASGGGGLQGTPGAIDTRDEKDDIVTRKLQTENNVTVDEVMRLIMEKGILL
tara:strand:+ start:15361 stop:17274 length:1914 start_codon:yes stop_codon:yes gene_type:complete